MLGGGSRVGGCTVLPNPLTEWRNRLSEGGGGVTSDLQALMEFPWDARPTGHPMRIPMGRPMGRSMGRPMGSPMARPMGSFMGRPMGRPMGRSMGIAV